MKRRRRKRKGDDEEAGRGGRKRWGIPAMIRKEREVLEGKLEVER